MLVLSVLQFANPQIVNLLIDFVSSNDPYWKGYLYTVLIVLVTFMCTVLNSQAFYREYLVGLRIRTGLISAIYRKSLRLSNAARKQMTGTQGFYFSKFSSMFLNPKRLLGNFYKILFLINQLFHAFFGLRGVFLASNSLHDL